MGTSMCVKLPCCSQEKVQEAFHVGTMHENVQILLLAVASLLALACSLRVTLLLLASLIKHSVGNVVTQLIQRFYVKRMLA